MRPSSSPAMPASDEVDIYNVRQELPGLQTRLMSDTILPIHVFKIFKIVCNKNYLNNFHSVQFSQARLEVKQQSNKIHQFTLVQWVSWLEMLLLQYCCDFLKMKVFFFYLKGYNYYSLITLIISGPTLESLMLCCRWTGSFRIKCQVFAGKMTVGGSRSGIAFFFYPALQRSC